MMTFKRSLALTVRCTGFALLCGIAGGIAGCVAVPAASTPGLRAVGVQGGDQVAITGGVDHTMIDVTSARGIGKAQLEQSGPTPQALTLKLRLKGLEELRLSWGDTTLLIHVASGDGRVHQEVSRDGGQAAAIDDASPYWARVVIDAADTQIPIKDGYFTVTAPPAFLEAAPQQFALQWIDFYR